MNVVRNFNVLIPVFLVEVLVAVLYFNGVVSGAVFIAVFLVSMAATLFVFAWPHDARRRGQARSWTDASAEVLEVRKTGLVSGDTPEICVKLRVHFPPRPPYESEFKVLLRTAPDIRMPEVGSRVPIKVNPQDADSVFLGMEQFTKRGQ